ncbi:thioesterase domain-containing protein [Arthrobacter sp. zg-Y1116]|uniref:thioesterase domain-containing protein n=1 Tax=Arthrobacter sp. zg-Y1116 TaxID=2964611 RepID=UPI0021059D2D|nr:thioesterase domain-containing protein [Arthrobacter sp. zg-Y1116]MCQ1946354.1 hypothetical protein [Arthrobacter sp. zg-Y1116]
MDPAPLGPPEKPGTLVFLPGTGQPNPQLADRIREQMAAVPGLSDYRVLAVDWAAAAPDNVSFVPALPPRYVADDPPGVTDTSLALALFGMDLGAADPLKQASSTGAPPARPDAAFLGETLQDLVLGVLTEAGIRHRIRLTDAAGSFFGKVAFYLRHGPAACARIADTLRSTDQDAPVVLFGHSLGSVAAVDLLSSPEADGFRVDLLVTVGSQAPWFYLLDALAYLGPVRGGSGPAVPWLNFWDERDLISFCAERVFAGREVNVTDSEVDSGKPFPESHTAYFSDPRVYRQLWEHLREARADKPGSGNGTGI